MDNAAYGYDAPRIAGSHAVWTEMAGDGVTTLYLYELVSGAKKPISPSGTVPVSCAITSERVVWLDWKNYSASEPSDVHVYDIASGTDSVAFTVLGWSRLSISGSRIVYLDESHGYDATEVWLYDLAIKQKRMLPVILSHKYEAVISGDIVVWGDDRNRIDSGGNVYAYDLGSGQETLVGAGAPYTTRFGLGAWGDVVVWGDGPTDSLRTHDLGSGEEKAIFTPLGACELADGKVVVAVNMLGVYVYDLSTGTKQLISDGPSEKNYPSVWGNTVLWWDSSFDQSIFAYSADYSEHVPPSTNFEILDEPTIPHYYGWRNADMTFAFTAIDPVPGSGLAYTEARIDDRPWSKGEILFLDAPADHSEDGSHTLHYRSVDNLGNIESEQTYPVGIDTRRPITKAPYAASGIRFRRATLKFKVIDAKPNQGEAYVTIKIKNRKGRVVQTVKASWVAVNKLASTQFRLKIARGTYRFLVYASDAGGNKQSSVGWNRLVVK